MKHITLKQWIDLMGAAYVADLLGINTSSVNQWRRGHCLPKVAQMRVIKKLTRGACGYEQIIDGIKK